MNALEQVDALLAGDIAHIAPDTLVALAAVRELAAKLQLSHEREDVLLRLLQGLTGLMKNGWEELPVWAVIAKPVSE